MTKFINRSKSRNQYLLCNPVFIAGLVILILNDHYFKWTYANWLTGKLSDFVGLLIFPLFLQFLFPRLSTARVMILAALAFIFWKSPVSESFIQFYNLIALIPITRVVDVTDLLALVVLPLSYTILNNICRLQHLRFFKLQLNPLFVLIPCSLVFMATSPPVSYYMKPNGDIHIGKTYRMKMNKEAVLAKLKQQGYTIRHDTTPQKFSARVDNYVMENVVLPGGKDTISAIEFGFYGHSDKPLLLLNNVTVRGNRKLSDWKELKKYSNYYKKLIKEGIIEEVK